MQNPGPIALRAAADAEANVGVVEQGGNNRGKYVEIYQKAVGIGKGDPWCAAFCRYREEQADNAILDAAVPSHFPDSGYTPDYKTWAIAQGLWIPVATARETPSLVKRGDLALFYMPAQGRIAHIGIVVEPHTWGVWTVEGNTSPEVGHTLVAGQGVNRDGDGVWRKKRDWAELGSKGGFARLPF
jgi:hypothetical protein